MRLSHRAPTILDPTSRLSSPAVLHPRSGNSRDYYYFEAKSSCSLDGHQPWRLNVSIYVSWECPGLLPRTSSLEARLLLREVFASNRSAPTITGMITRRRCCTSMDIKVFMLENISFILIIIISVVRSSIKDTYIYISARRYDVALFDDYVRAIDSKFQSVWRWLITLNRVVKYHHDEINPIGRWIDNFSYLVTRIMWILLTILDYYVLNYVFHEKIKWTFSKG